MGGDAGCSSVTERGTCDRIEASESYDLDRARASACSTGIPGAAMVIGGLAGRSLISMSDSDASGSDADADADADAGADAGPDDADGAGDE
jgi:hypothetical protein